MGVQYTGVDIVAPEIAKLQKEFADNDHVNFLQADIGGYRLHACERRSALRWANCILLALGGLFFWRSTHVECG